MREALQAGGMSRRLDGADLERGARSSSRRRCGRRRTSSTARCGRGTWREFVGQERLKEQLEVALTAAITRGEALDHVLLVGPPGLGKTSLAYIVREELGVGIRTVAGPALERKGDLAAILTSLEARDVLFIDEIHRLNPAVEEILYPALEDFRLDIVVGQGPAARTLTLDLPPFTLVGATTRTGLLTTPLRDRFGMTFRLALLRAAGARGDRHARGADPRRRDLRRRGRRDRPALARHAARREPDPAPRARRRRGAPRGRDHDRRSPPRRSSCSRSTRRASSAPTASCSRRSSTSSTAGRSGSRRSRSRSARSRTRSRTSTSRTCSSSGFIQRTPRGRSSPTSGSRTSPTARRRARIACSECPSSGSRASPGRSTTSSTASIRRIEQFAEEAGRRAGVRRGRARRRRALRRSSRSPPEPGYGFVTIRPHPQEDVPAEVIVPVGSIKRIELSSTAGAE